MVIITKKHILASVVILLLLSFCAVIMYQGKKLARPTRRKIQNYHNDWLDAPQAHGISIQKSILLKGKVPCLIVTPNASAHLGKRGVIIKKQLTERGLTLPEHGTITGNIVLLHGRNGRKEDLLPVAERFCAAGLRCIIPDLPAHGESPIQTVQFGLTKWEAHLPQQLLLECAKKYHFSPTPTSLWGMSMGGSFANHAASLPEAPWKCLVIVSSFDRLENVIDLGIASPLLYRICRSYGGASIRKVNPSEWAKSITIPVLVAHGTADSLIDIKYGKSLHQSYASTQKKWVEVPGGDHGNVLTTPMPLYAEMAEWVLKNQ